MAFKTKEQPELADVEDILRNMLEAIRTTSQTGVVKRQTKDGRVVNADARDVNENERRAMKFYPLLQDSLGQKNSL